MARFLAAALSGAVYGFEPATRLTPPYDLGWFVTPLASWLDGSLVLEHTGDVWGGNTAAMIAPERKLAVVVLINAGVGRAEQIARGALARAAGLPGADPGVAARVNGRISGQSASRDCRRWCWWPWPSMESGCEASFGAEHGDSRGG